jgi:predicted dehydrogenase
MIMDVLGKYSPFPCFSDHHTMLSTTNPDAVVIAVPTKYHAEMVEEMLERRLHVFVEKPFCLDHRQSARLASLAAAYQLVNQVGYHNKFIGTFREVKKLLDEGWLGELYHFHGQAHGPVVVRPKQDSWRTNASEGGGCLMDYASHVIDLVNYLVGPISEVRSSVLQPVFSGQVEDAVYAMVVLENNISGMLSVNWSDDTYRKMSTSMSLIGTKGKIISDANECKVYFRDKQVPRGYNRGWNIKYVTDLTPPVDFYLRGEEYSAQMDQFIAAIQGEPVERLNDFSSAALTDRAIHSIREAQS